MFLIRWIDIPFYPTTIDQKLLTRNVHFLFTLHDVLIRQKGVIFVECFLLHIGCDVVCKQITCAICGLCPRRFGIYIVVCISTVSKSCDVRALCGMTTIRTSTKTTTTTSASDMWMRRCSWPVTLSHLCCDIPFLAYAYGLSADVLVYIVAVWESILDMMCDFYIKLLAIEHGHATHIYEN